MKEEELKDLKARAFDILVETLQGHHKFAYWTTRRLTTEQSRREPSTCLTWEEQIPVYKWRLHVAGHFDIERALLDTGAQKHFEAIGISFKN